MWRPVCGDSATVVKGPVALGILGMVLALAGCTFNGTSVPRSRQARVGEGPGDLPDEPG